MFTQEKSYNSTKGEKKISLTSTKHKSQIKLRWRVREKWFLDAWAELFSRIQKPDKVYEDKLCEIQKHEENHQVELAWTHSDCIMLS